MATENKGAKEKVGLAISAARAKGMGTLEVGKLKEEVESNYVGSVIGEEFPVTVIIDGEKFIVPKTGKLIEMNKISKTTSYVGYYADIDVDGVVDGIIYADLALGNIKSGQWGDLNGIYTIPKVDKIEELKDYYANQTNYKDNDGFGTKDVISPIGTGVERFYIMALKDIGERRYHWYNEAYNQMLDYASTTFIGFGKGKSNTTTMMSLWNSSAYGTKDEDNDMWGQIQAEVDNGWFVPSTEEWAAFSGELEITESNYKKIWA